MPPDAAVAPPSSLQEDFLAILLYMGTDWILYLLLVLSVVSLAVALERGWYLWSRRDNVPALQKELDSRLRQGDMNAVRTWLATHPSHPARVVLVGLEALDRGAATVEEILAGATQAARLEMERGVAFLGTLGNNAPFIGLFGTVLGIIRAFRDLAANTLNGSASVMAGIAEALVTTAVGLMVALPAVALFNFLQRRIRVQLTNVDALAHVLLAHAKSRTP